jgi:hypothetical protein
MARYNRTTGTINYVLVCDDCGAERAQIGAKRYRPNPKDVSER